MNGENSGQWVMETRNAVLGGALEWAGEHRGWLFGHYGHSHPGGRYAGTAGLVALRLRDGAVFRVDVPGAFVDGMQVDYMEADERIHQAMVACAEAAREGLQFADDEELSGDVWRTCAEQASSPDLVVDASGLSVLRPNGQTIRVPFSKLLRALPN